MNELVIDTNVLLVANGAHAEVSLTCVKACVERLLEAKLKGVIVLDDGHRILSEYQNKLIPNGAKSSGEAFLKWLLQTRANHHRVHYVSLTESSQDCYVEFPDATLEAAFDPPDRKFVAVAHSHVAKPTVLQAADCKWLDWWESLAGFGVRVEFLCPNDICVFYRKKFPNKAQPALP